MPLAIGQFLQARYRILGLLGQGGMGAVYLAEDTRLPGRRCAIKENVPDPTATPQTLAQLRQQFLAEASILSRLDHSNLPKVSDYFTQANNEYLVMDYVEGENLQSVLDRTLQQTGRPLPEHFVLPWIDQVLDALEYLHGQQPYAIIHRDIKPSNIILTAQGKVKLVDFGLVKLLDPLRPGTATVVKGFGTPEYAALEQHAQGAYGHTDARTDIYALGATLYHLLTGAAPPDAVRLAVNPVSLTPPRQANPALSAAGEAAILKAMAVRPDQRFQTAREMRLALPGAGSGGQPLPSSTKGRLPGWVVGAAAGASLVTMIFLVVQTRGPRPPSAGTPVPAPAIASAATLTSTPTPLPTEEPTLLPTLAPTREPTVATPTPQETPTVSSGYPGTYTLTGPEGGVLTFKLADNGFVRASIDYPDGTPSTVISGTWQANADGGVTATLTQQDGQTFEPQDLQVTLDTTSDELVLQAAGGDELRLARVGSKPATMPAETTTVTPTVTMTTTDTSMLSLGIGSIMVSEKDGIQMVYVPAGEFTMGSPDGQGSDDEYPQHTVSLYAYWIDKTEVTAAQYGRCVESGTCSAPDTGGSCTYGDGGKSDHPINCVDWNQAEAYCRWSNRRLPTEAEWEKAARGTDGRVYPWGDSFDGSKVNFCDTNCSYGWKDTSANDGYHETAPVGSYPAGVSPYDALDMAGNVWEWVADWYDGAYYASTPLENQTGHGTDSMRVLRGGSWVNVAYDDRSTSRYRSAPDDRYVFIGFRCARSPWSWDAGSLDRKDAEAARGRSVKVIGD